LPDDDIFEIDVLAEEFDAFEDMLETDDVENERVCIATVGK